MSADSSANNCPTEDRFAPYKNAEDSLCQEIARCHDAEVKEQLTWNLATFFLETARPEKAVAPLQLILDSDQTEENQNMALRILQFLFGSEVNAIPTLGDTLDLSRVLWEMGNTFLRKGNQHPGVLCLLRLLDISSDQERRAECFLLLGIECEKVDEYEGAVRLYRRGIECEPKGMQTRYFLHNNLGYCYNELRLNDDAEQMCRVAIEIDPQRYNAYKNLGMALLGLGEYAGAAASFLSAANIFPPDSRSVRHMEELLAHHGEDVERKIPNIAEHLAMLVEVRERLMQ